MASINQQCLADQADGKTDSPFCINEDFRTENGGGAFDPFDETEGIDIFIAYFPPCSFQSIRTSQIPTRSSVKSHSNNYWSWVNSNNRAYFTSIISIKKTVVSKMAVIIIEKIFAVVSIQIVCHMIQ